MIKRFKDTQEWLDWRKKGIGGSDIATIMGHNPYQTPYQLWEEKCGFAEPKKETAAMAFGKSVEGDARAFLNEKLSLNLDPVCVEDDYQNWFKASLDGLDATNKIVCEIKAPTNFDTIEKARNKEIPQMWLDQLQWNGAFFPEHQLLFGVWDELSGETVHFFIPALPEYMQEMRKKAQEFWDLVRKGIPPEKTEKDRIEIRDTRCISFLISYGLADEEEKQAKEKKKQLKSSILEFCVGGDSFSCHGYTIFKKPGRVSYDMEAMKKDGINIEKYSTKGEESFTILKSKKEKE